VEPYQKEIRIFIFLPAICETINESVAIYLKIVKSYGITEEIHLRQKNVSLRFMITFSSNQV